MKNRIVTLLFGVVFVFASSASLEAQGLLRGLKERAEQGIGNVVGSFLGTDNSSSANYSTDTPESSSRRVGGTIQNSNSGNSGTVWQNNVKPSTASTARALFNELPAFPTADEMVSSNEAVRDNFLNKVYSVKARIDELNDANKNSDDDYEDAILQSIMGSMNLPQMGAMQQNMLSEQMVMEQMFGGMSEDDIEQFAESMSVDVERLEKLQAELEQYEKKKNLTDADKKRMEEISFEIAELIAGQLETINGISSNAESIFGSYGMQMGSSVANISSSNNSGATAEYQEFLSDFAAFQAKNELEKSSQKANGGATALQNIYKQIWAETNQSKLSDLYGQANNFLVNSAQARLEKSKTRFKTAEDFLARAEKLAANSGGTLYAELMKGAPLEAVNMCATILAELFEEKESAQAEPVLKSKINLPIEASDRLILGESNYVFMMEQAGLSSLFGTPKEEDTIVEDFLSGATFLVYDRNGNPFKIENGKRTAITGNGPINFYKSLQDVAPSGDIPMKSLNKKINFSDDVLTLPDGSVYYPIAIQRTNDWLSFIIEEGDGVLTKCMYRL